MNVLDKSALRECTSCQLCGAVCPKNAITLVEDEYGFEIRREITPVGTQLWLTKTIEEEGKLYECSYIYQFDEDFTSNAKYTIEIKKILKGEAP